MLLQQTSRDIEVVNLAGEETNDLMEDLVEKTIIKKSNSHYKILDNLAFLSKNLYNMEAYNDCPEKFLARPKLPKYKHKTKGRNLLAYTKQAISKTQLHKKGKIRPSKTTLDVPSFISYENLKQVRN